MHSFIDDPALSQPEKAFLSKSFKDKNADIKDLDKVLLNYDNPDKHYNLIFDYLKQNDVKIIDNQEDSYEHTIIGNYNKSINNLKKIPANKEKLLIKLAQKGDTSSRNKLIESNLKLINFFSLKYLNQGISQDDLIQEGSLGLIKAIENYDINKDIRLSTYASWYIRQYMTRYIASQSDNFSLPIYIKDEMKKIAKLEAKLIQENQKNVSSRDILNALENSGIETQKAQKYMDKMKNISKTISLSYANNEEDLELEEKIASKDLSPEQIFLNQLDTDILDELLNLLPEKNKQIIIWRFGLNNNEILSLTECGKKLNISKERVRQIEKTTMRFLNSSKQAKEIKAKFLN